MKYILVFLLFLTAPFYMMAEHSHGGNHGGSNHSQPANHPQPANMHGRGTSPSPHARLQQPQNRAGGSQRAQRHWDGNRFDRDYHGRHFGYDHRFGWRGCAWYGNPFFVGSRFWWGGVWFSIMEPIPDYWYDGEVYIDEYGDAYYIYNPAYPGVRFRVGVVF